MKYSLDTEGVPANVLISIIGIGDEDDVTPYEIEFLNGTNYDTLATAQLSEDQLDDLIGESI